VNWLGRTLGWTLIILSLGSCQKLERAPQISQLRFPVVLLFENSGPLLCQEPAAVKTMHTNYLKLNNDPPILIDSDFNIYSLEQFRSVHGGLWLMTHPSGATEVAFELKPQKSGREKVRSLFLRQLQKQTWRQDLKSNEAALSDSQTLLDMLRYIKPTSEG
jgi:hypothetical protein